MLIWIRLENQGNKISTTQKPYNIIKTKELINVWDEW